MPTYLDAHREAARGFLHTLARELRADEVLADKQCVRMLIDKAKAEHTAQTRKRFDPEAVFRRRLLYGKIDDILAAWCRRHDIHSDPFNVFRYEGPERGPTQHETAVGLARPAIERAFNRLTEQVPELADCRKSVLKDPTRAPSPAFRFQHPLPFGAAGEVKYGGTRADLDRLVYQAAMYAATAGDTARGWRYDCGVVVFYCSERPRTTLGDAFDAAWPSVMERVWDAGRVSVILL